MKTKRSNKQWFGSLVPLDRQVRGLDVLRDAASNKRILDLGSAEGHVGRWLNPAFLDCVDWDHTRTEAGHSRGCPNFRFFTHDLNEGLPDGLLESYDVVLLLAILQKMRRPLSLLKEAVGKSPEWVAIRSAYSGIKGRGSDEPPFDCVAVMNEYGYKLVQESSGYPGFTYDGVSELDEAWLGVFKRCT